METPLIILKFTNEAPSDPTYLRSLKKERGKLLECLEEAEKRKLCEIRLYDELPLKQLLKDLGQEDIRRRLVIFHYAGHADSLSVRATDSDYQTISLELTKLNAFFKDCPNLRLIFLNACCTIQQAEYLLSESAPAVIGTDRNIADDLATEFAYIFYDQLKQNNLDSAFRYARAELEAQYDRLPERYLRSDLRGQGLDHSNYHPFIIRYRQNSDEWGRWTLSEAAGRPLFGLPAIPDTDQYRWPVVPYDYLKPYAESSARIFRGRDWEISRLFRSIVNRDIQRDAVVTISGQSGVGKSSLLRAGLLPRLSTCATVIYLRRQTTLDFRTQLLGQLECRAEQLDEAWAAREEKAGKPLIVIFDQVDELFNQSDDPGREGAWKELTDLIRRVLMIPGEATVRRVVLSYRTEVHQRISNDLRQIGLAVQEHLILPLDRKGILEIVHGLDSEQSEMIRQIYQLSVEAGLGEDIASYLLRDTQSPIAPVLQIIMTRLWQGLGGKSEDRSITREAFRQLSSKGVWLNDFYEQQIAVLREKEHAYSLAVESSGLVLDILNYHTTGRSTAQDHTIDQLLEVYGHHQPELIRPLLTELEALSLLAFKMNSTILAHDTLAIIIKEAFERSTRPGQHALRILQSKMIEYRARPDEVYLEEPALDLVLAGKQGMRKWEAEEDKLIQKSIQRLKKIREGAKKLKRARRNRRIAGALGLLLLVVLTYGLIDLLGQNKGIVDFEAAQARADKDPTLAVQDLSTIYLEKKLDPEYEAAIYEVYHENLIYEPLFQCSGPVNRIVFSPNGEYFALTTSRNHQVYLYDWQTELPIDSFDVAKTQITDLYFSEDNCLFITSVDRRGYRWCKWGSIEAIIFSPGAGRDTSYLQSLVPLPGTDTCYSLNNRGLVYTWSTAANGRWLDQLDLPGRASAIATAPNPQGRGHGLWIGTTSGAVYWSVGRLDPQPVLIGQRDEAITCVESTANGRIVILGTASGKIECWEWQNDTWILSRKLSGSAGPVQDLQADPAGLWLAVVSEAGLPEIWDLRTGDRLYPLAGQAASVKGLAYDPQTDKLWTGDEEGNIRSWAVPYPGPIRSDTISDFSITRTAFDEGGNLFTVDKNKSLARIDPRQLDPVENSKLEAAGNWLPIYDASVSRVLFQNNSGELISLELEGGTQTSVLTNIDPLNAITTGDDFGAVIQSDTILRVWQVGAGEIWRKSIEPAVDLSIALDGAAVITATNDGLLYWYDPADGTPLGSLQLPDLEIKALLPAAADQVFVLDDQDRLWACRPGSILDTLTGGELVAVAGQVPIYVAAQGRSLQTYTWSGHLLETFQLPEGFTMSTLSISPTGNWIAVGSSLTGSILFWRTAKRALDLALTNASDNLR